MILLYSKNLSVLPHYADLKYLCFLSDFHNCSFDFSVDTKNAKIHPPKQQTVKPFFQSSCVNGQDTVVTCSEQNAKLDYLALQQCQKDTNLFQNCWYSGNLCKTQARTCSHPCKKDFQDFGDYMYDHLNY
jgi:hypothetical protein